MLSLWLWSTSTSDVGTPWQECWSFEVCPEPRPIPIGAAVPIGSKLADPQEDPGGAKGNVSYILFEDAIREVLANHKYLVGRCSRSTSSSQGRAQRDRSKARVGIWSSPTQSGRRGQCNGWSSADRWIGSTPTAGVRDLELLEEVFGDKGLRSLEVAYYQCVGLVRPHDSPNERSSSTCAAEPSQENAPPKTCKASWRSGGKTAGWKKGWISSRATFTAWPGSISTSSSGGTAARFIW